MSKGDRVTDRRPRGVSRSATRAGGTKRAQEPAANDPIEQGKFDWFRALAEHNRTIYTHPVAV